MVINNMFTNRDRVRERIMGKLAGRYNESENDGSSFDSGFTRKLDADVLQMNEKIKLQSNDRTERVGNQIYGSVPKTRNMKFAQTEDQFIKESARLNRKESREFAVHGNYIINS